MKDRAWLIFLIAGTVGSIAAALTGSPAAMGAVGLATGVTAAAIGLSRKDDAEGHAGPWRLFSLAGVAFISASIIRLVHGQIAGESAPFPSPADAVALSGHVFLILGATRLGQLRSPERDRTAIIDGAIIAIGVQTPVWATLLYPYLTDPSIPLDERVLNGVYNLMTTIVLAIVGRLAVGPGARTLSYRLLALAVLCVFVQDTLATVNTVNGLSFRADRALTAPIFVLFGAAGLHPHHLRIAEARARLEVNLSWQRVAALVVSLLIPPVVIGAQIATGNDPSLVVASVSMGVLILLVMIRFWLLAKSQERSVRLQGIQRDANADLAAASSRHGLYRVALRAVGRLVDRPDGRVSLAEVAGRSYRVVDAVGRGSEDAIATTGDLSDLTELVAGELLASRSVAVDRVPPVDVGPEAHDRSPVDVLVVPLVIQARPAGAIIISTSKPITRPVRESIETLASTLSLALESATLTENLHRRRSERRFRALVENSSDMILVVDEEGFITFSSPATQRLLGLPERTVVGSHPARWVHPDDWAPLAAALEVGHNEGNDLEVRVQHVDGSHRWFEVRVRDLRHDPEIDGLVVTAREISDRKATEERLAESEAWFRALVQNSSDVVAVVDNAGRCTYVSPAIRDILGYEPEELVGRPALEMLAPEDVEEFVALYPELSTNSVGSSLRVRQVEVRTVHRSGDIRVVDITLSDMRHEPAVRGIVLNVRDVTVRKALERDLRYQALHDSLTGLPNRTMFTQQIAAALRAADGEAGTVGALVIDLDDFKTVNDSLGHAVGDELLKLAATRLAGHLTSSDFAARLGGDEFAVLVRNVDGVPGMLTVANNVLDVMSEPFRVQGREIRVTCSIGIAVSTGDLDAEILLRSADVAMYLAKDQGKARAAVFEAHLHTSIFERLEMKADLVRAIEDGQLRCVYQPMVSLQTGRLTGVEALVRWEHPERGLLSPDVFISLAEDTGLIVPLGRWVLHEACQQLRQWQLLLSAESALTMSVNLSVRQLSHEHLVRDVREAVQQAGLDPSMITLEITETTLMNDTEANGGRLRELHDLGLSLAVDDFGTGYSSLQYVQRFPVDIIKIDRSFISGLGTNPGDTAVVQSMIELSQRLGVHTVAEGIDRPEQVTLLRSLGADLGQGFLFSPPITADEITRMLEASPQGNPRLLLH
ncbi:MAG: EAL domain-containing protein [Actinobacteria bacterium]|nr:EAL domain-containing protein [Actinomycetota bacterium]